MRKILTIFLSIISLTLMAQVPQGVGYQGIATDANGIEIVNQAISIRASVLSGSANGTIEWEETHATSTDAFGLFTLTIGQGTNTTNGAQTSFTDISWGTNTHFLKIEMDVTGGTNYSFMGTNQMMSVPYALYAESANINYDSISNLLSNDSTFITNVGGGMGGSGCDYSFPDGLDGDPIQIDLTSSNYTVPSGKNLYILQGYTTGGNATVFINGLYGFNLATSDLHDYDGGAFIATEGDIISLSSSATTVTISGILINKNVDPLVIDLTSSNYTVPSGKNLYIFQGYTTGGNATVFINGLYGFNLATSDLHDFTAGNYIAKSGDIISLSSSATTVTISAYLADENYFAGCGGGGSSGTGSNNYLINNSNLPPNVLSSEMFFWDANYSSATDTSYFVVPAGKNLSIINLDEGGNTNINNVRIFRDNIEIIVGNIQVLDQTGVILLTEYDSIVTTPIININDPEYCTMLGYLADVSSEFESAIVKLDSSNPSYTVPNGKRLVIKHSEGNSITGIDISFPTGINISESWTFAQSFPFFPEGSIITPTYNAPTWDFVLYGILITD